MNGQAAVQTQTAANLTIAPITSGLLQRACACGQHSSMGGECEECKQKRKGTLQRAAIQPSSLSPHPSVVPPIVHEVLRSPGQPLDAATRSFMEPRFGHDFSKVRVHTDAKAALSAQAVNALAYTAGRNVVFGMGQYAPQTSEGKELIAHELTHVVQQSGVVDHRQPVMRMESSIGDRFENEANIRAKRITQGQTKEVIPVQDRSHQSILQRQADMSRAPAGLPCWMEAGPGHPLGLNYVFDQSKADLSPEAKADIALLINMDFKKDGVPDKIIIHGFASVEGTQEFNWRLSCTRAEAIKAELVRNGIPADKIMTIAHGESTEFSATDLSANRRAIIETVYQPKPTPVPPTPKRPDPSTEDCEPWQTTKLKNALKDARIWVDDAQRKIAEYADAYASTRHSGVMRSAAIAKVVGSALQDNFHTLEPGYVREIAENFASLRKELNKEFTFECEDQGCKDRAYVRGAFSWLRRRGDIHVCPPWFQCNNHLLNVTTLIHERAHQYPGAGEDIYEDETDYATMSVSDAIDNASSYAVAARQIYHNGAHGPGPRIC